MESDIKSKYFIIEFIYSRHYLTFIGTELLYWSHCHNSACVLYHITFTMFDCTSEHNQKQPQDSIQASLCQTRALSKRLALSSAH